MASVVATVEICLPAVSVSPQLPIAFLALDMAAIINLRAPAGTVQNALNLTDDQFGNLKVSNS